MGGLVDIGQRGGGAVLRSALTSGQELGVALLVVAIIMLHMVEEALSLFCPGDAGKVEANSTRGGVSYSGELRC